MSVAIADAFRYVATSGTNAGEVDGTLTAPGVGGTLTIVGGFGITLTADTANRKITITNTGNGTGALTTITSQNSGTYYPVFTSIPGTFNPATGTYTSSTLYYESTTTPLSYNTTTGTLNVNSLVLGGAGTFSLDGVTSTGVTGTGNVVFGTSPTLTSPTILTSALFGPSASANLTRFPNAQVVVSTVSAGIQQNEGHNIGIMAEAVANASNSAIYGIGVYGAGYTNSGTRSGGVVGEGHVSASADAGSAIGVRGYATDTHAGGLNVGLYGDASNGSSNYALALNNGNILSNFALSWTLNGNLTFSGAYTVIVPTLNLTNALGVSYGGTGTGTAGITAFNNISGYTASGATGTTSTNLVFSTSPTFTTTIDGGATFGAFASVTTLTEGYTGTAASTHSIANGAVANGVTKAINIGTGGVSGSTTNITIGASAGTNTTTVYGLTTASVPAFNLGTTSITFNRASGTQSLTGVNIDGSAGKTTNIIGGNNTTLLGALPYQSNTDTTSLLSPNTTATKNFLTQTGNGTNGASPAWGTLAAGDIPSFNLGTTSITFNRSSATQSLTGINIDGSAGSATKATNLVGGNNTTLLGSIGYQSNTDTTTLLSPNTTATLAVLTQTGNGTNGAAPVWTTSTGTGSVVLQTNPSLYAPSFQTSPSYNTGNTSSDADVTYDASQYYGTYWSASFTANRALNVSNLINGRTFTIWIRNTNASPRTITINASSGVTGFATVNLAVGGGAASSTTVTLAATSGTAMVILWSMGGNLVGMVN